ncbi:type IV toxin-antitoxin system AbiEi family antitoxin domain-containing protein [Saccharopolyspora antimicrobica]
MVQAITSLGAYTAGQWGLVTAAQAKGAGVDSVTLLRLVDAGLLVRVRHGVYQLAVSEESAHLAEKAAWLALRPAVAGWVRPKLDPDGGVVSHRSAALLQGLGDLVSERIEITVPRRRATRDSEVKLRGRPLDEDEVTRVDGLPVTTVERTVIDLLNDRVDASHMGQIIHEANRRDRLDLDVLAEKVGCFSRRYGVTGRDGHALIEHLLSAVQDGRARAR